MRDAFPHPAGRPPVRVVIGLGNAHRRDDGVGLAVAAEVGRQCPGVPVVQCAVEPAALIDAWDGADVAVIVDAAVGQDAIAGRVRRGGIGDLASPGVLSSHDLDLAATYRLAAALGRAPAGWWSSVSTWPTSDTAAD